MEKSTGKTIAKCYVEFINDDDASSALNIQKYIKGRRINVVESSQDELFQSLFPSFHRADVVFDLIPGLECSTSAAKYENHYISQLEIAGILTICKRFKVIYSVNSRSITLENALIDRLNWSSLFFQSCHGIRLVLYH